MENKTSRFLGSGHLPQSAVLKLEDVQPLHGGVRVTLYGSGRIRVTRVTAGKRAQQSWEWVNPGQVGVVWRLLVEQDFLTIEMAGRPGLPDEARPSITLRNHFGRQHTVAKWAGVPSERFDAIYDALLAVAAQAEQHEPLPRPKLPWGRVTAVLGILLLAGALLLLANRVAVYLVNQLQEPVDLVRWLGVTAALVLPFLLLAFVWKRRIAVQKRADRLPVVIFLYVMAGAYLVLLFGGLFMAANLLVRQWGATAVAVIQSKEVDLMGDPETGITTVYLVEYSFETDEGEVVTGKAGVSRAAYQSFSEGDEAAVYYLPFLPAVSAIDVGKDTAVGVIYLLTALLTILFWLIAFLYRDWRLKAGGKLSSP